MYLASSNVSEFPHPLLPVVGLTIGGTYLLFTQGSTVVLKALQKESNLSIRIQICLFLAILFIK